MFVFIFFEFGLLSDWWLYVRVGCVLIFLDLGLSFDYGD